MLRAGLDLSRQMLDVRVLDEAGRTGMLTAVHPEADALRTLVERVGGYGEPAEAAIQSENGAPFVHDTLGGYVWDVAIADALRAEGLAPLVPKINKIDAWVLVELACPELVPAIRLPESSVRAERELARFRLHLVRHRTALKNRIHPTLIAFANPVPPADLYGIRRQRLGSLAIPSLGP